MSVTLRRTDDRDTVAAMHQLCMPGDDLDIDGGAMWLAYDEFDEPVGFCACRPIGGDGLVFLSRSGVLKRAGGQGLQRRMINARVQWARKNGFKSVITYTLHDNFKSTANLIRSSFQFYRPVRKWFGDVNYFWRDL